MTLQYNDGSAGNSGYVGIPADHLNELITGTPDTYSDSLKKTIEAFQAAGTGYSGAIADPSGGRPWFGKIAPPPAPYNPDNSFLTPKIRTTW